MPEKDAVTPTDLELFQKNPLGKSTSLDDIIDNFEFLDDWESRYTYIIDLGKLAPSIPEAYRVDENRVLGCQSQVWFVSCQDPESGSLLTLVDSDAMIVKGLAAIVMAALNQRPAQEVGSYDMDALFERLDLIRHLSPTRGNGLRAMVKRIQDNAKAL